MLHARVIWVRLLTRYELQKTRPFCTNNTKPTRNDNCDKIESSIRNYDEAYQQLDKLDFMTATKMLFTDPPKKKKFGIDFHLVQLFFVCMPSFAVYLVAQYARYEIRKMELEQKKKQEEEEKAKEVELNATEEKDGGSDPELLEVKVRLNKLEEAVKEIVVESKKQSCGSITKNQEDDSEKKQLAVTEPRNTQDRSESSNSLEKEKHRKNKSLEQTPSLDQGKVRGSTPVLGASQQGQKGKDQNGGPS